MTTTDAISIRIFQKSLNSNSKAHSVVVAEGFGSWLEYISFTNDSSKHDEIWWDVNYEVPEWSMPSSRVLESDSSNRRDRYWIIEKNFEEAERAKAEMEDQ